MNKKRIVLFFCLVILFCFFVSSKSSLSSSLDDNETIRVFVSSNSLDSPLRMKSSSSNENLVSFKKDLEVIHDFGNYFSVEINKSELESLENISLFNLEVVSERELFLTQSVPLINATTVFNTQVNGVNLTGKGETVCIVDTWVDFNHPDLLGKNLTCVLDCVNLGCLPNCSLVGSEWHGTHIAGIIGANGNLKGVAPEVNIINARACVGTNCFDDNIIAGINWCVNNSKNYNISVISLSLGSGLYSSFCDNFLSERRLASAVNSAIQSNISVVAATGNENSLLGIASPSCMENVTRVSSITKSFTISDFSNRVNSFLDILFSPGTSIFSTYLNKGYAYASGTSMATPHVSGAVALLNQYKRLEGKNKLTPVEISSSLVNSGGLIYDSSTEANYSVLDVYSAILNIDSSPPNISLLSPKSNLSFCFGEVLFEFEVNDLQLNNISIFIWDLDNNLIDYSEMFFSPNQVYFNYTANLSYGNYLWGIYSSDKNGNFNFSSNYSFHIDSGNICSSLSFPEDGFYSNSSSLTFACESFSNEYSLSNVSLFVWNSSSLIFSEHRNISGNYNLSYFNLENFSEYEEYSWACVSYDTSSNFSFGNSNYSLYFDFTPPVITLSFPSNSVSYSGSQTINFLYNVEDENLDSCSLIINGNKVSTSYISNGENSFSYSLSVGSYTWDIECNDLAMNKASSSLSRQFTISSISSSGGSGGGGSVKKEKIENYSFSNSEITLGKTTLFSVGQSANFFVNDQEHSIVLKESYSKYVVLDLFSNPIQVYLMLNSPKRVDLDKDNYYDLELNYFGIINSKANISIKKIHEEVYVRELFNDSKLNESFVNDSISNSTYNFSPVDNYLVYKKTLVILLWSILALVCIIFIIRIIKFLIIYLDPKNRDILKYKVPENYNKNESI